MFSKASIQQKWTEKKNEKQKSIQLKFISNENFFCQFTKKNMIDFVSNQLLIQNRANHPAFGDFIIFVLCSGKTARFFIICSVSLNRKARLHGIKSGQRDRSHSLLFAHWLKKTLVQKLFKNPFIRFFWVRVRDGVHVCVCVCVSPFQLNLTELLFYVY